MKRSSCTTHRDNPTIQWRVFTQGGIVEACPDRVFRRSSAILVHAVLEKQKDKKRKQG